MKFVVRFALIFYLTNANNTVPTKTANAIASSDSSAPIPSVVHSSVSAPSVVISSSPQMPPTTLSDENGTGTVSAIAANGSGGGDSIGKQLLHVTSDQSFVSVTVTPNSGTPDESSSPMVAIVMAGNFTSSPGHAVAHNQQESKNVSSDQQQQSQFGRQRGHAKTPPVVCSKSNSMTRGASPIEAMPILDEQDQSASTVIQSVIQQVLSENNSVVDGNEENEWGEQRQNGRIPHDQPSAAEIDLDDHNEDDGETDQRNRPPASSSTVMVHYENLVDSSVAPPPRPPTQPTCQGHQNASPNRHKFTANITTTNNGKGIVCGNGSNGTPPKQVCSSRSSQGEVLSSVAKKQPQKTLHLMDQKKFHRRSASDRSPAKLERMPQSIARKPTHQKSSTWEPHQAQQQHKLLLGKGDQSNNSRHLLDMMDPITLDVERRMSTKAKEADAKAAKSNSDMNNDSADDDDDVFGSHQHRHTGLDHGVNLSMKITFFVLMNFHFSTS